MKVYCHTCEETHVDKDGFPPCDFLDGKGFGSLSDEDKQRLWEYIMNPLFDELTVRYNLACRMDVRAEDADCIMVGGKRRYYPAGYSSKWRRVAGDILFWFLRNLYNIIQKLARWTAGGNKNG